MHGNLLTVLAGIGLIAIVCQWFAWWVKLPAILFLLLAGIVAGPVTGWLDPEAVFGDLLFPMVSLAVAVILFEGSLTLRFSEIKGLETVVRRLVTTGLGVTWMITTLAVHFIVGLDWGLALLFGAVTVVTGPTVIVPMLRTVRPNARLSNILRWEGIMIDPIGALLAVLVFEFIVSSHPGAAYSHTLITFGKILGIGILLGAAAGYFLGIVLRRHWLPDYLHNVATLTLVFGVFAASNLVQEESGLLTVTVMGLWLANMKNVSVDNIIDFKESLSVLLISGLFIILAARVDLADVQLLAWTALGVLAIIQFVARPAKVLVSTFQSTLTWRERALLAWIAPRGIVAAAVAALFAIRLEEQGWEGAQLLVPLTFMVIIGTVVLQSATARPLARALGVAEPEPKGYLIVGANPVARALAKALKEKGIRILLADSNWDNIRAARMDGLQTYYGNVVSEHADRHLDLVGIGRLLAMSPRKELNALACMRYRGELGEANVFSLAPSRDSDKDQRQSRDTAQQCARTLFNKEITYARLASLLGQGGEIRETRLTQSFTYEDYRKQYQGRAVELFAVSRNASVRPFYEGGERKPTDGWLILSLVPRSTEEKADAKLKESRKDSDPPDEPVPAE